MVNVKKSCLYFANVLLCLSLQLPETFQSLPKSFTGQGSRGVGLEAWFTAPHYDPPLHLAPLCVRWQNSQIFLNKSKSSTLIPVYSLPSFNYFKSTTYKSLKHDKTKLYNRVDQCASQNMYIQETLFIQ